MTDESNVKTVQIDNIKQSENILQYAAYSSLGARDSQQDSSFVGANDDTLLAAVCDGMGGMNGGELASETAIRILVENFYQSNLENIPLFFKTVMNQMDESVYALKNEGKRLGAGTTIVSIIINKEGIFWLSVGDSRIYLYRRGELICPVRSHTYRLLLDKKMAEEKITADIYAEEEKKAEALISFLGIGGIHYMDINQNPFIQESGDQILLCSDGLYKSLSDQRILEILKLNRTPGDKSKMLVEEALENGGKKQDNTSVILIQIN